MNCMIDSSNKFLKVRQQSIAILFMAVLTFLIYSNTSTAPFVLDDSFHITDNPHIRLTDLNIEGIIDAGGRGTSYRRPVPMISFALNYYFHGYKLLGYHLVNIVIHIITGILLYFLIKTTLSDLKAQSSKLKADSLKAQQQSTLNPTFIAFFAALIWLVHPIQTQSVNYIVQRMNGMAVMFYILSLLLYAKGRIFQRQNTAESIELKAERTDDAGQSDNFELRETSNQSQQVSSIKHPANSCFYYIGSLFFGILALGSKEIAATLPFFIFLYEWYFFQELNRGWLKRYLLFLFAGIFIVFALVMFFYLEGDPVGKIFYGYQYYDFNPLQRVLTESRVVVFYLSLLILPHFLRLNFDHDFPISYSLLDPPTTILSIGAVIGLTGLAFYTARKERLFSFCILWFLGNLVIESSFVGMEIIYEHRLYLPSMFLSLMTVIWAYRLIKLKWFRFAILGIIVIVCSVWTYERNNIWRNQITLWNDCVKKSPNSTRSHNNIGIALAQEGRINEAIGHYNRAIHIDPNHEKAYYNLGNALISQGNMEEAIDHFLKALRIKPNLGGVHNNLGVALFIKENTDKAIEHFKEALRINSYNDEAHNNLGKALYTKGRKLEALKHYSEALRINPYFWQVHNNIGVILLDMGKPNEAINHFKETLRLKPGYANAHNNLINALSDLEKIENDIKKLNENAQNNLEDYKLYYELGNLYKSKGEMDKAMGHYQKALRLNPDDTPVLDNLAKVYAIKSELGRALPLFMKSYELQPDNADISYYIACIYSRQNKIEESIEWLDKAINSGFNNWDYIKADPNLENIRGTSYYKPLNKK